MGPMGHWFSGQCSQAPQNEAMGRTQQHRHLIPKLGSRCADVPLHLPELKLKRTWERWQVEQHGAPGMSQKPSPLFGGHIHLVK